MLYFFFLNKTKLLTSQIFRLHDCKGNLYRHLKSSLCFTGDCSKLNHIYSSTSRQIWTRTVEYTTLGAFFTKIHVHS